MPTCTGCRPGCLPQETPCMDVPHKPRRDSAWPAAWLAPFSSRVVSERVRPAAGWSSCSSRPASLSTRRSMGCYSTWRRATSSSTAATSGTRTASGARRRSRSAACATSRWASRVARRARATVRAWWALRLALVLEPGCDRLPFPLSSFPGTSPWLHALLLLQPRGRGCLGRPCPP